MAPVSMAASGNMSWRLKTSGTRQRRAATHPARPSVTGGDIANTASGLAREATAAEAANVVKPANPAARAATLPFDVGNGWTLVTPTPPRERPRRSGRPRHSGSTRCWRYQGSEVTTRISWPRPASSDTMAVMTSPVGATSGA